MLMKPKLSKLEKQLLNEKFKTNEAFNEAVDRLSDHEPLAYILGEWYFYGETYKVSPDCLIPRPETEHLVDKIIKLAPPNAKICDLCTGSGCVAISALVHRQDLNAVAIDVSEKALEIAKENAALNNVSDRITFIHADILSNNPIKHRKFDIIASNPPYIQTDVIENLQPEVKKEPYIALDGGKDGLVFYRRIFSEFINNLNANGKIICEIGYDQGDILKQLFNCNISKDYSGNDRIASYSI